jgi:hypothetical protein
MADFVDKVNNARAREALSRTLPGRKPFGYSKTHLAILPGNVSAGLNMKLREDGKH